MKRSIKVAKEIATYLVEKDMESRGWLVTDKEVSVGLELVRKNMKEYILLNGDKVTHTHGSWTIERKCNG